MFVIRPIRKDDLEQLERVAFRVSMGMLNLPKHPGRLNDLLQQSVDSFEKDVEKPYNEFYLFVLEDTRTGDIGGTCGIFSKTSVKYPTFHYRIVTLHPHSERVPLKKEIRLLQPVSYMNSPSEVGALYLLSEWRSYGLGRLLSLCRFMFIATEPQRFNDHIISHIRGHFDKNGTSPFWEGVGRHFLDLELSEVFSILEKDKSFVADIVPEYPLYTSLLSEEAQECIGKAHKYSQAALNMLVGEGFEFANEIDIFEGGPKFSCPKGDIRIAKDSVVKTVGTITDGEIQGEESLICNNKLNFRCCLGSVLEESEEMVSVTKEVADALEINTGDSVRYSLSTDPSKEHS